jgi:hypothetical protein
MAEPTSNPTSAAAGHRPTAGLALLRADLEAYRRGAENPPHGTVDMWLRVLTLPRLQALVLFRLAQSVRTGEVGQQRPHRLRHRQ